MNLKDSLTARLKLKTHLRQFFQARDYLEVETPIAVQMPGTEVHLDYFNTQWQDHHGQRHPLWLRSSPEIHLKKLLSHKIPRLFEFATCFRNHGELSQWHHPEFTMLEWYESQISYMNFMQQTEDLFRYTWQAMKVDLPQYVTFKLPQTFHKLSVTEAFKEFAHIDLMDQDPELSKKARHQDIHSVQLQDDFETAFFKILIEKIEPELKSLNAVFLYDYPASQSALAKEEGTIAKRFECYINGIELCNAFLELLSMQQNKDRIQKANKKREKLGKAIPKEDMDFYDCLNQGLPPCCGNALGFDRWLALLLGQQSLAPIIPFSRQAPFNRKSS